jgi:copper homeostasis protein
VASSILLEISVESAAHRIELCSDLRLGGLTPSEDLMRSVRECVKLPIFAMIRPRAGDFVYSDIERFRMRRDIAVAQHFGMDGIVLGLLGRGPRVMGGGPRVDAERTQMMVLAARPLPVTFHRAFDEVADLDAALKDVMRTGAARILTSGGAASAAAGVDKLAHLVTAAKERVIILPGGGVNASNVVQVARQSGAREIHSGLGSVLAYGQEDYKLFEDEVRKLAVQLEGATL